MIPAGADVDRAGKEGWALPRPAKGLRPLDTRLSSEEFRRLALAGVQTAEPLAFLSFGSRPGPLA